MIKNKKVIVWTCAVAVVLSCSLKVLAKPISNSLMTTITVISTEFTVGKGDEYAYSSINDAIDNANEEQIIKIQGGAYSFEEIIDKNVTLESADGNYVDIEITGELPTNIKLDDKVTINKKGVAPIDLTGSVRDKDDSDSKKSFTQETTLDVKKGATVVINTSPNVVNVLGFHNAHLKLKLNNDTGVTIEKNRNSSNKDTHVEAKGNGEYDLGVINDKETTDIYLTFPKAGIYTLEVWADDGR